MGYFITHRSEGKPTELIQTLATATIPRRAKRNLEKVRIILFELKTWMRTEQDDKTRKRIAAAGLALNDLLIAHDLENE